MQALCDFATTNDKPLGLNLSAPFVIQFYMDAVKATIKHADFVFCNEDEGSAFATANNLEAADRVGAAKIIASWEKASATRPRRVIITQGVVGSSGGVRRQHATEGSTVKTIKKPVGPMVAVPTGEPVSKLG